MNNKLTYFCSKDVDKLEFTWKTRSIANGCVIVIGLKTIVEDLWENYKTAMKEEKKTRIKLGHAE